MAEEKAKLVKLDKKKVVDPVEASCDVASQEMVARATELGIETVFDRNLSMKPCNIGIQGTCCKNCAMVPVASPFPKEALKVKMKEKAFAALPLTP